MKNIIGIFVLVVSLGFQIWVNTGYESIPVHFRSSQILNDARSEKNLYTFSHQLFKAIKCPHPKNNSWIKTKDLKSVNYRIAQYNSQVGINIVREIKLELSLNNQIIQTMSV